MALKICYHELWVTVAAELQFQGTRVSDLQFGGVCQHLSADFQKTLSQASTLLSPRQTKQQNMYCRYFSARQQGEQTFH